MSTLLELRTIARQISNTEKDQFVTDSELNYYVNASGAELYGILATSFKAWNVVGPIAAPVTGSANTIALPSDFWMLHGLDIQNTAAWFPVNSFNWAERGIGSLTAVSFYNGQPETLYSVQGQSTIYLIPEQSAQGSYRYWYIPKYADMVADDDTADDAGDLGHWEQYIVVDVAIRILLKMGDPVQSVPGLMAQKEALKRRIELESSHRDDTAAMCAVNVRRNDYEWDYPFGGITRF